jgi:hypothetical protein
MQSSPNLLLDLVNNARDLLNDINDKKCSFFLTEKNSTFKGVHNSVKALPKEAPEKKVDKHLEEKSIEKTKPIKKESPQKDLPQKDLEQKDLTQKNLPLKRDLAPHIDNETVKNEMKETFKSLFPQLFREQE